MTRELLYQNESQLITEVEWSDDRVVALHIRDNEDAEAVVYQRQESESSR